MDSPKNRRPAPWALIAMGIAIVVFFLESSGVLRLRDLTPSPDPYGGYEPSYNRPSMLGVVSLILPGIAFMLMASRIPWRFLAALLLFGLHALLVAGHPPILTLSLIMLVVYLVHYLVYSARRSSFQQNGPIHSLVVGGTITIILLGLGLMASATGSERRMMYNPVTSFLTFGNSTMLYGLLFAAVGFWLAKGALDLPREFRCPRRLPRIPVRRGMTLIELLIVVAILAIMLVAVANASRVSGSQLTRARDARQAVEESRHLIARYRAGAESLSPAVLTPATSAADMPTTVTVSTTRPDGLVPVLIEKRIGSPLNAQVLAFEALIHPRPEVTP